MYVRYKKELPESSIVYKSPFTFVAFSHSKIGMKNSAKIRENIFKTTLKLIIMKFTYYANIKKIS